MYWGSVPGAQTIWSQVQQLLPAHYMTIDAEGIAIDKYWHLSFANKEQGSDSELLEGTRWVVGAAVKRRMKSDVPLGAFLSGASTAATGEPDGPTHHRQGPNHCAAFDDDHYSEGEIA